MRRIALLTVCLITFVFALQAQGGRKESTIYLKNGRVVKGYIIKKELGTVSVLIIDSVTNSEKTQVYQQTEIKKIEEATQAKAKEGTLGGGEGKAGKGSVKPTSNRPLIPDNVPKPTSDKQTQQDILNPIPQSNVSAPLMINQPIAISGAKSSDPDDYIDHYAPIRPKRQPRVWNRDIRGFRAFIDYGYVHGVGKEKNYRFEYAGSIGFQFNPIFYTGIGTGYYITLNNKDASIPVFINPRINFLDEYKTPFLDVKVGYSVAEGKGFYFTSSLGMSFTKKGKRAFNLGLFYSLQNAKYYAWTDDEPPVRKEFKPTYHGVGLRLTYEFGIGR